MHSDMDATSVPGHAPRSREVAAAFDSFFAAFLRQAIDAGPPDSCRNGASSPEAAEFSAETELRWRDETLASLGRAGPAYTKQREARHARLAEAMESVATEAAGQAIDAFISAHIDITSGQRFFPTAGEDFYYLKINHGYWEQLLALFVDPSRVSLRIRDASGFRRQYLASGFMDALSCAIRNAVSDDGSVIRFPRVHFGVSLSSGTADHPDVLREAQSDAFRRQVVLGAAIGVTGFFESLFGPRRLSFCDGSFPKRGLATGLLRESLQAFAAAADRVILVVPPHLRGIRIAGVRLPHEHFLLSGSMVHESWAATLFFTVGRILQRIATGDRVLVITQSAVFSALLGLCLQAAKDAVVPDGRVSFFDLGQVTDIANPPAAGSWLRNHAPTDLSLFTLDEDGATPVGP